VQLGNSVKKIKRIADVKFAEFINRRHPNCIYLACTNFYRMAISLCFDGHVRNVGSLGLDLFVTFTVASATELPADTVLTMVLDRWGRRWLACGSMVMSGIFSLLATAVPTGEHLLHLIANSFIIYRTNFCFLI
jgi:hypothetical protein